MSALKATSGGACRGLTTPSSIPVFLARKMLCTPLGALEILLHRICLFSIQSVIVILAFITFKIIKNKSSFVKSQLALLAFFDPRLSTSTWLPRQPTPRSDCGQEGVKPESRVGAEDRTSRQTSQTIRRPHICGADAVWQ